MTTTLIHAPWTSEQVDALNRFQQAGGMHPFTCGALHASGQSPVLDATHSGWICPDPACDYTQDWAHAFMIERGAAAPVPPPADQAAPADWIDRHPQLEAIAAAVWEQCGRSDSGMCVEDDPRNIAVAALTAVLPPSVSRADVYRQAADELATAFGDPTAKHIGALGASYLCRRAREIEAGRPDPRRMADEAQPDTQAKVDRLTALTAPALLATIKELRDLHAPLTEALTTVYQSMKSCVGDEWAMEWLGEVWTQIPLTVRAAAGDQDAADELAAGAQQDGARR